MIKEREWISVKDKLPDRSHKSYLVWATIPGLNPVIDIGKWDEIQQGWYGWYHNMANVTHWMPLPSPPNDTGE